MQFRSEVNAVAGAIERTKGHRKQKRVIDDNGSPLCKEPGLRTFRSFPFLRRFGEQQDVVRVCNLRQLSNVLVK